MRIQANNFKSVWHLIASLPILWAVGGDQFIIPIIILTLFFKRLYVVGPRFGRSTSFAFWSLWLLLCIVSTLMIEENVRYVTWVRNFVTSFSGICCAYLVYESHADNGRVKTCLMFVMGYAVICSMAGFAGVMGANFSYTAPLGKLIPFGNDGYLFQIFTRSFVMSEALWFSEGFIRPKGLLLYANLLSGVVLVGLAVKLYVLTTYRVRLIVKIAIIALIFADGIVVVSSLSRSAWIGLAASIVILLLVIRLGAGLRIMIATATISMVVLAYMLGAFDVMEKRFVEKGHSNEERMLNYVLIEEAVLSSPQNFVLGFGTQRDVPEMGIPLGSHSTYMGLLYKYGVLGFSLYMGGLIATFVRLKQAISQDRKDRLLGAVLMFSLVQIAVQGLFIEIDVDVVYMLLWWVIVGLCLAYAENILKRNNLIQSVAA